MAGHARSGLWRGVVTSRGLHSDSRLDTLSRVASALQPAAAPAPVDAQLSIVESKHGSLLQARLPPYSQVVARVGQIVGQSAAARTRATTRGAFAVAALRPLLGRAMFVQEVSTEARAGDVLIAPRAAGDLAVVGLTGRADYFVRRGSVLAQTRFVQASTWAGLGAAFNALAFDRVSGRGALALNAAGGLHRLVLAAGETYLVDPRFAVAWSASLDVRPQSGRPTDAAAAEPAPHTAAAPHKPAASPAPFVASSPAVSRTVAAPPRSPAAPVQTARKSTLRDLPRLGSRLLDYTALPAGRLVARGVRAAAHAVANAARTGAWAAAKTLRTLAGVPDLYLVTGPGEIYVSSRVQPKPWTRVAESVAAKSAT
ncbi:hypothetical protein H4S02_004871 [Coemansia sp. RSA 2611]|nr:hypothetical protein H4S01_001388 [Coemansia sp. RSA 2610]KAJ2384317.1 hypothetical protein H4S02_004871 [Coemansia sp. RSA 2611]